MTNTGLYPRNIASFGYWQVFDAHGTLPFSGGYAEQPAWWIEDVRFFELINELEYIKEEINECDRQLSKKVIG